MAPSVNDPFIPQEQGTMTCGVKICGRKFAIETPQREIINTDKFSLIAVSHIDGVSCPGCGTKYVPHIAEANVLFGFVLAQDQTPAGIIKPASGVLTH
jgi:hypothetical protein